MRPGRPPTLRGRPRSEQAVPRQPKPKPARRDRTSRQPDLIRGEPCRRETSRPGRANETEREAVPVRQHLTSGENVRDTAVTRNFPRKAKDRGGRHPFSDAENRRRIQPTDGDETHDPIDNDDAARSALLYSFYVDHKTGGEPCSGRANADIGRRTPRSEPLVKEHNTGFIQYDNSWTIM